MNYGTFTPCGFWKRLCYAGSKTTCPAPHNMLMMIFLSFSLFTVFSDHACRLKKYFDIWDYLNSIIHRFTARAGTRVRTDTCHSISSTKNSPLRNRVCPPLASIQGTTPWMETSHHFAHSFCYLPGTPFGFRSFTQILLQTILMFHFKHAMRNQDSL